MDRNRFSAIAHRNHSFHNPISEAKMNQLLPLLDFKHGQTVIDIGAGNCELLIRMVENYQIKGTAIELYEGAIEEAKKRASARIIDGSIDFIVDDAKRVVQGIGEGSYDVGVCIGSTHALGGLELTLRALQKCVKPGGYLLIGEGYWKKKPSTEYLQALGGAEESELQSHYDNVMTGEQMGLVPNWAYVASEDDWDEYEWLYAKSIEDYCYENPDDPDYEAMRKRISSWRQTYLKWGRDTLGFGLYLFRNGR